MIGLPGRSAEDGTGVRIVRERLLAREAKESRRVEERRVVTALGAHP